MMMMIFILCTYHSLMLARGLTNSLTSGCAWSRELHPCEDSDLPVKHDSLSLSLSVSLPDLKSQAHKTQANFINSIYIIYIFNIIVIIKLYFYYF